MAQFVDIQQDQLLKLRDGLEILGQIWDSDESPRVYLYGISNDPVVLDAAREAIAEQMDDETVTEDTIQLAEVAVCIPLSGDVIYALTGSGITLEQGDDEFAYVGGKGEGIRTSGFNWARVKPQVAVGEFTRLALAGDSVWLDRFLQQRGTNQPAQIQQKVQRSAPAVAPTPQAPTAPVPKQTSLKTAKADLGRIVEDWLR